MDVINCYTDLDTEEFGEPKYNLRVEPAFDSENEKVRAALEQIRDAGYFGNFVVTEKGYMLPGLIQDRDLPMRKARFDVCDGSHENMDLGSILLWTKIRGDIPHLAEMAEYLIKKLKACGLPEDTKLKELPTNPDMEIQTEAGSQSAHIHLEDGEAIYIMRDGEGRLISTRDRLDYDLYRDSGQS